MKPRKSSRIRLPAAVRRAVLERDRHRCRHCGKDGTTVPLQIDHIIPIAQGGTHDLSNLQVLCRPCNQAKKAKTDPKHKRSAR